MRQFASGGFRLWNLGVEAKVLYSAFCLLILCGIASSALYYSDLVGGGLVGVRRYYGGEAQEQEPERAGGVAIPGAGGAATSTGGPAIDLPADGEVDRRPIVVAVTYRKLLEVTHFHLFTMPVVLLIVGHLFFATALSPRAKLAWVGAASATVALHIGTPWLVRYGSTRLAFLHAISGAAMTLTMGVLTVYPIVVMWRRAPARGATSGPPDTAAPAP
jgi:hypothetical protein